MRMDGDLIGRRDERPDDRRWSMNSQSDFEEKMKTQENAVSQKELRRGVGSSIIEGWEVSESR
jgi:hypothetical protein